MDDETKLAEITRIADEALEWTDAGEWAKALTEIVILAGGGTHGCPAPGSDRTSCCGRPVRELGLWNQRITRDPQLVTCKGSSSGKGHRQ